MALLLDGVTLKDAGHTHIYPTNLSLADASVNVLLGQTLAGKTSLMRLMAGLDKPSAGRLSIGCLSLVHLKPSWTTKSRRVLRSTMTS